MPTLLVFVFLAVGMLFGENGFGIHFDNYDFVQVIGMVALGIILSTGGMDTRFEKARPVIGPGTVLATAGVLIVFSISRLQFRLVTICNRLVALF